jgi:L-lactate dehydrogenase complex protein LldF
VVEAKRRSRRTPTPEALVMRAAAAALANPRRLAAAQRSARLGSHLLARKGRIGRLPGPLRAWSDTRDSPQLPAETFRSWWQRTHPGDTHSGDTHSGSTHSGESR